MKPSVFISRSASRSKEFVQILNDRVSKITTESLIEFVLVEAPNLPQNGWLFFYSQTGVDFFLEQHTIEAVRDANLRLASFGPKTGDYLQSKGLSVHFRGNGDIKSTAETFQDMARNSCITFVRGVNSLHSLKNFLPSIIIMPDMIVYDNHIRKDCQLPFHDILVFTSPMNIKAYQNSNQITENQAIITIGATTAMEAMRLGMNTIHIAEEPSMKGLANTVIDYIQNS